APAAPDPAPPEPDPVAADPAPAPPPARTAPAARPSGGARGGALSVTASHKATVYLDGRQVGRTPLRLSGVAAGDHRVRVVVDSKASRELVVPVMAGVLTERAVEFATGNLVVKAAPWAEVRVDGKRMGVTPMAPLKLVEGEHQVVLDNKDLKARKTLSVTIEAGKDAELKVKMAE
ncbi:MAG: PEGA domain-containing protein, partial [Deltaproteobacteria bacterium]|nr:PEGA domain-containing protein [Deltaproteobacteria bacterium]